MIKSVFNISKSCLSALLLLAAAGTASCTADEHLAAREPEQESDNRIRVRASVMEPLATRADEDVYTEVENGTYCLTYPVKYNVLYSDTTFVYSVGRVLFGQEGAATTGFVTYQDNGQWKDDGKWKDMKWNQVVLSKNSDAIFYLDNVLPSLNDNGKNNPDGDKGTYKPDTVVLKDGGPFKAGLFKDDFGENDLLWGEAKVKQNTPDIEFILHHNMSRVRVEIEVLDDNGETTGELIDLSRGDVTLEITNLYKVPKSFRHSTGDLELPKSSELTESEKNDMSMMMVGDGLSWADRNEDEDENIYKTQDFVLPPQTLSNQDDRPRLKLMVPAENIPSLKTEDYGDGPVEFSAYLPQSMFEGRTDDDPGHAMTLAFMKERILTISAKINGLEMELEFKPVLVEEWVNKGRQGILGMQAGIYNSLDFANLMKWYKAGNETQLKKYGYKVGTGENAKWLFQFWNKVTLDINEITGGMAPTTTYNTDFAFDFRNYTITVAELEKNSDGKIVIKPGTDKALTSASGQTELYNIVTGQTTAAVPKITNNADFEAVLTAFAEDNKEALGVYGTFTDRWVFDITEDITLEYADVAGKMAGGADFLFNIASNKTVTITNTAENDTLVLAKAAPADGDTPEVLDGETLLQKILATPTDAGGNITTADEFYLLIDVYNHHQWLLYLFGTQSGNTWTFNIDSSINLDKEKISSAMKIEDTTTLDYNFKYGTAVKVTVIDNDNDEEGTTTSTPTVAQLKSMMQ